MSESNNNPALRIGVIVLAVIGGLAVLSVAGMALMHFSMMGGSMMRGFGC
jgi:hypothetical protein